MKKDIKATISKKDYFDEVSKIHKFDYEAYDNIIKHYYQNNKAKIHLDSMFERLSILIDGNLNLIEKITILASSVLAAISTSYFTSEAIKPLLNNNLDIIIRYFVSILITVVIASTVGLIFLFILLKILDKFFNLIDEKELDKNKVEIDIILDILPKNYLKKYIWKKHNNKSALMKYFAKSTVTSTIASVVATVIVLFLP